MTHATSGYDDDMIDHVTLSVSDLKAARDFYTAALEPLGYEVVLDPEGMVAFGGPIPGLDGKIPDFFIREGDTAPVHIAFMAMARDQVDGFHAAGVAAGGSDNGGPGLRPQYGPGYYAAFVIDPDGNNIEAVMHERVDGQD